MATTQFIAHQRVVPPSHVPRRGLGLFGALVIVIFILSGAATGGVVLMQRTMADRVEAAKKELAELDSRDLVSLVGEASRLQKRIEFAKSLLDQHVYVTSVFPIFEKNILENFSPLDTGGAALDRVYLSSFSYSGDSVKVDGVAPGFMGLAAQAKVFDELVRDGTLQKVEYGNYALDDSGNVGFSFSLTLNPSVVNSLPVYGRRYGGGDNGDNAPGE